MNSQIIAQGVVLGMGAILPLLFGVRFYLSEKKITGAALCALGAIVLVYIFTPENISTGLEHLSTKELLECLENSDGRQDECSNRVRTPR